MERILIDEDFLTVALEIATKFFIDGILPEVLGKWYSKLPDYANTSSDPSTSTQTNSDVHVGWCFCGGDKDNGEMIASDNELCKIGWFHTHCLRITKIPNGKWYCPDCTRGKRSRGEKKKVS